MPEFIRLIGGASHGQTYSVTPGTYFINTIECSELNQCWGDSATANTIPVKHVTYTRVAPDSNVFIHPDLRL